MEMNYSSQINTTVESRKTLRYGIMCKSDVLEDWQYKAIIGLSQVGASIVLLIKDEEDTLVTAKSKFFPN